MPGPERAGSRANRFMPRVSPVKSTMQDFEKLGAFYLGKVFDLEARAARNELLLYDDKDLTTHAVCVGMTGSGKTGLCLALLEEAAIDGVPAIAIDPKGDLGNLLLTFPELRPADFQPWIDPGDAARKGVSIEQLAETTATSWKEGLAAWGQSPDRIRRFRDSADVAIYTPGGSAGLPLTVLRSFAAPPAAVLNDNDALRERVTAAASGLLALLGVAADPLRSREHILLSMLLERAWREGRNLDLGGMIREIQSPPFDKIGVMDLESIFPAADRFALSMSLNNLLASPGFAAWMEGEPLDIQRLLYTPGGKPRLSILSIAHLSDSERMFFVTILLNEIIAWMRTQPGTSSLRAILYMDEVFGYFPPTANPPCKIPMLTLLKQARAFGLGIVLATQNPVDLDYKGLSNAGTWFIGRLQTERDKARVLDGLEGASAAAGSSFDRQKMETIISGLGNRVFLLNNVHDNEPVVMQTRWALSYLRGPLTREQIQTLMSARTRPAEPATVAPTKAAPVSASATAVPAPIAPTASARPMLPPEIPEFFVPCRAPDSPVVYRPVVLGTARVHFAQTKSAVDIWETVTLEATVGETMPAALWDDARMEIDHEPELEKSATPGEHNFAAIPAELTRPKDFQRLSTSLKDFLYRTHVLKIWKCSALKQVSKPGETEGDFRARLSHVAREERDAKIARLKAKYAPKLGLLQERLRRAMQRVEKEKAQASQQTTSTVISIGTSLIGALFGKKTVSAANVGRAATAARAASRIGREKQDVTQAEETMHAVQVQLDELNAQFEAETEALDAATAPDAFKLDEVEIKPKKADIGITRVVLAWTPWNVSNDGIANPAF
jgi:hypothetical protein